ncbi:hypothetical protein BOTBODRAFT_285774 [Botryobasidium botryosum FD-172 SS1]|uniref:Palmitoyltransferase PFA4 n=1 Tax=Botryobasidium botryosum (strain FD-172 SS1) TaxID=930990 RepID=A0A067MJG8_BOTB1|nr:hypothetical protein BOTBODRAFT_285774 [Botryobasidium botryosum FD-172 SS1]
MARRLAGRLWVTFTSLLIAFIAYTSQIFVFWPWYGREFSVEFLIAVGPFNVLVGLLYWNYFLTVRTDAGRVPDNWKPDLGTADSLEVKKLTGAPRYCRTCAKYKPPRTHHCKQCKRCVLRMDHHCPWVDNCVGHFNYGYFIRFLFYVDLACSYHLALMVSRSWDAMGSTTFLSEPSSTEMVFIVLNYTACIPVILAVGGFSLYHFYCLSTNTTTIEGWEKDKVATLIRRGKIRDLKFPYNLGIYRNICAVLGPSPLRWCWPQQVKGSGLSYPLAEGTDTYVQYIWPPRDPSTFESNSHVPDKSSQRRRFKLPDSPWTYGEEGFNPMLVPSNAQNRSRTGGVASAVPPYHPSYRPSPQLNQGKEKENDKDGDGEDEDEEGAGTSSSPSRASFSSDEDFNPQDIESPLAARVRRGSEGWEVRPFSFDLRERVRQSPPTPVKDGNENAVASEDERKRFRLRIRGRTSKIRCHRLGVGLLFLDNQSRDRARYTAREKAMYNTVMERLLVYTLDRASITTKENERSSCKKYPL